MSMLRAFDAYAQTGRVRRAALLLGVSHAIVSRHLRGLEEWLGVMLIDRGKGGLTTAGAEFHARIGLALDEITLASERLRGGVGSRMTIWCVPGFAYLWLTSRLHAFSALHPAMALDLRPTDASADLVRHEADADIRWVSDVDAVIGHKALESVAIARPRVFPVARRDATWLKLDAIQTPTDILKLPLLHEESDRDWHDWMHVNGLDGAALNSVARLWQAHMTLAAASEGQGVALTNYFLASDLLDSGDLIELGSDLKSFPAAYIGAYRLSARKEAWQVGPVARFRQWLEEAVYACPAHWA